MDDIKAAVLIWAQQQANLINLVIAIMIIHHQQQDGEARWPYREPHEAFGPLLRYVNAFKDEADGGLSEYAFTRYTRFTKAHVVELAYKLNLPTEYCWDPSTNSHHAKVEDPKEA